MTWIMATDSTAATGGRAGITFDVELVVLWDALEAVVDLRSDGVILDVMGLTGRRPGYTMVRILQERNVRSIYALVPDPRGLEQSFHDVTIVDMGDLPKLLVSMDDLSLLRRQWPAMVLRHMVWLQQDLHIAFRKDYLTCLRVFVPQAAARSRCDIVSPVQSGPVSMRHGRSAELDSESPQKTRRAPHRMRPVRILEESVGVEPLTLTVQDASDMQGAIVYDCWTPWRSVVRARKG